MTIARSKALLPLSLALLAACGSATDARDGAPEASATDGSEVASLPALAAQAVDADEAIASRAIAALREAGPAGLEAMMTTHADAIARLRTAPLSADRDQLDALRDDADLARLRTALDGVAAQRDAFASGLYWYTDLDAARIEAARSGRPILSLRLLGRLDEEASCANSRFFRWLLYPSPEVRAALAGYVLHWSSERPAPHVTIDMGDGRTIERTITGNSVHYVLDASGRVIDAIAGLHTPADFAARLAQAQALAERCGVRFADRACVATEHAQALARTRSAWEALGTTVPSWDALVAMDVPAPAAPTALAAMPLTIGKAAIEMPLLRILEPQPPAAPVDPIAWDRLTTFWLGADYDRVITDGARALARLKTGRVDDGPMLLATFRRTVQDSVRNQFTLDRRLHAWLAAPEVANDFDTLNTRVYAELFLTPASDPWLGLRGETDWDVLEVTTPSGTQN